MKNLRMMMGLVGILSVPLVVQADRAVISFSSATFPTTYKYATSTKKYQRDLVAYILNNTGGFVRTIESWGNDLEDIIPWSTVSGNVDGNPNATADAVSSATVSGAAVSALTTTWDGKDANKTAVASGTYWLVISATAKDFDAAPPILKIKLDVGGTSTTITAADSSLNNGSTYLSNLSVVFTGSTKVISKAIAGNKLMVKIGDSPMVIPFNNENTINVSFFSLNGVRLMQQIIPVKSNGEITNVPASFQTPGTYICRITTKSTIVSQKIILKN